jgi:hypothetical protein
VGFKSNCEDGRSKMVGRRVEKMSGEKYSDGVGQGSESDFVCSLGSQEGIEKIPSSDKFERGEQRFDGEENKIRTPSVCDTLHSKGRLDDNIRYKGGLSSCENSSRVLGSSSNRMEGEEVCKYSPTFWSGGKPLHIHESSESNGEIFKRKGFESFLLHRRFPSLESVKGGIIEGSFIGRGNTSKTGLVESRGQRLLESYNVCGISGSSDRYRIWKYQSDGRKTEKDDWYFKNFVEFFTFEKKSNLLFGRNDDKYSIGLFTSQVHGESDVRQYWYDKNWNERKLVEQKSTNIAINKRKSDLVYKPSIQMEWEIFFGPRTYNSNKFGNRFVKPDVRCGVGGSDPSRSLGKRENSKPHWGQRVGNNFDLFEKFRTLYSKQEITNQDRQYDSSIICLEGRRKEGKFEHVGERDLEDCSREEHYSTKTLLDPVKRKLFFGWVEQRVTGSGMESQSKGFRFDREKVWEDGDRSICFRQKQEVQKIQRCNKTVGERSGSNRLFHTELAWYNQLCNVSFSTDRKSAKTRGRVPRRNGNSGSKLEISTMVEKTNEFGSRADGITFTPRMLWGTNTENRASQESKLDVQCNEDPILIEFVHETKDSWAPSTREKYLQVWLKLEKWLLENKKQVFPVKLHDLCEYLLWLRSSAPSEVAKVMVVLGILEKFNDVEQKLSNNQMIKRFVEAVERKREKMRKVNLFLSKF